MHRPPMATLLASLVAHGGAVATLFFLVSGESHPDVLFIDLETMSEREATVAGTEPQLAKAGGATKGAPAGSARPAGRDAGRSGAAAPGEPPLPSPVAPPAPTEPERARERDTASPEVSRQPEPAVAIVPAREAAPDVARESEANASPVEPRPNPGGAIGDRAAGTPDPGGGRRGAPDSGTSAGTGGGSGGTAVASGGPAGGSPGAEYGGYLSQMRRRLMEALRYPPPARSRGLSGTVLLDISIESNGAIANVSVTRSSSHSLLDEAALEAARSLAPQPFPKGLAPRPLRVRLPVVFDLQ
jgi:periplasmic protein TonB